MRVLSILMLFCFMVVMGCATVNVTYDYDPSIDFEALKTFAWMKHPKESNKYELVAKHIRYAVERELGGKGLQKEPDKPDVLVILHGSTEEKVDIEAWGYSSGRFYREGRYGGRSDEMRRGGIDVYEYQEGTVILDMVDNKTKELIWRSTAMGIVESYASATERRKRIAEMVSEMLADFPPSAGN
jgi:hypothetical protein